MVNRVGSIGLPGAAAAAGQAADAAATARPGSGAVASADGLAFDQILQQQLADGIAPAQAPHGAARVRFSAHAQQRLAQADVQLDPQALAKLEAAVDKADKKGGKESLILLDDLAFVVSVQNRTVITAVGADRMADNVFTKIDSVVIARSGEGTNAQET